MSTTALVVIDVQRSFEQMPFWTDRDLEAYKAAQNALISHARSQQWPVIFVYHLSRGAFSREQGLVTPMAWVDRRADDPVFYKRVHNALTESGLEQYLDNLGVSRLVISGIRTEQCCETTARVASDKGFEVEFVLDATLSFDMQFADGAVATAEQIKSHTALVLSGRFATVVSVADLRDRAWRACVNVRCPRSGGVVAPDSICDYNGHRVGFCNTGCRDSFAADPSAHLMDCLYFDRLIARQTAGNAYA